VKERTLSILFIVVALLFSAWGNVVAAAFCPRFALNRDCCIKHSDHQAKQVKHDSPRPHQMAAVEMTGMEMGDMEMESPPDASTQNSPIEFTLESSSEQVAFDLPIERCPHCASHSQPISGTASVMSVDPTKRLVESNSLPANFAVDLAPALAGFIVPSEHGPPGPSSPLHVLINLFRI
jgi:hypothetical protein